MSHLRGERAEFTRVAGSDSDSGFRWHGLNEADAEYPEVPPTRGRRTASPRRGGPLCTDGRPARRSIELVTGIYQSPVEGNRPVHLPVTLRERGIDRLREAGVLSPRTG